MRLTAHFEPAAGHVGGDWYDAVELESGELALAIGDVAGKGIPAAALMGELRGGLRAGMLAGAAPHAALRVLDRLANRAGHMATAAVVLLDPRPVRCATRAPATCHPPSIAPGGAVRFLTAGASTPLLAYDGEAGSGSDTLAPGERLVLYTDGLVERRGEPIDESLRRLAAAASAGGRPRRPPGPPPGRPAAPGGRTPRRHRDPRASNAPTTVESLSFAASQLAAVVKLVYTQASGACGLYARGGSSPLSRTLCARCYAGAQWSLPLSSRGLGRRPLTAETGVRIPVAVLRKALETGAFRRF